MNVLNIGLQQALILGIDFWDNTHNVADVHHRQWDFAPKQSRSFCYPIEGIMSEEHLTTEEKKHLSDLVEQHFKDEPNTLGCTD